MVNKLANEIWLSNLSAILFVGFLEFIYYRGEKQIIKFHYFMLIPDVIEKIK